VCVDHLIIILTQGPLQVKDAHIYAYLSSLRATRSGVWIPVGARFSAPVQTGAGAHAARGTRNDVTTWRIGMSYWISKATCTNAHAHANVPGHQYPRARAHTDIYVKLTDFSRQQWFANAPQYRVIRTLFVLLYLVASAYFYITQFE
jgi:hypothetical protein